MPLNNARAAAVVLGNLVFLVAAPALASDSSPWDGTQRAAVRLIAGAARTEGNATIHRAGVEIRIGSGWKTYWRYPGDSGLPPRFDFSGSRNVKSATVLWPAPQKLADESGTSIGYKHDVVFPVDVIPQDASKPVMLALKIDYAVCEKICVPADGKAELTLTGKRSENDSRLAHSVALVPKPSTLGADGALSIRAVKREGSRMMVDVAALAGKPVELFAEGPEPEWALPVPSPAAGAPQGQQRFTFELDGLPSGAKADGATLKLTAVAGEQAIEVPYRLD
jgi:DsbC/DsbD-like thiol-disulfide interchange protein